MADDGVIAEGYRFGEFCLFPTRRCLLKNGEIVPINPRALSILIILVERCGQLVTKEQLLDLVWPGLHVDDNNVMAQIAAVRKIVGRTAIECYPRHGYKFVAPIRRVADAPPLPAEIVVNLPQRLGALIGRDAELDPVIDRIKQRRLVSLIGPAGVGKTRFAIELGWHLVDHFPHGICLIDLAPLADAAAVTSAIATALRIALPGASDPVEAIVAAIRNRLLLMIFDNCEHLAGATTSLTQTLLKRLPGLSVLITSQQNLQIATGQTYRLNPLALPPPGVGEITGYGAIDLFLERARSADQEFDLAKDNEATIVDICRRLDGLPLALEMAAARLPVIGLAGLCEWLDRPLRMLGAASHSVGSRHRTLRETVDWSYGLLDQAEQRAFRRLGIFPGSFTLDAAIAVTAADGEDRDASADRLWRLGEKSLVAIVDGSRLRYRQLETLRHYAVEKLRESGEFDAAAEIHARYCIALFAKADEVWETIPDKEWIATYAPDVDNVRAALDWSLADPRCAQIAVTFAGTTGRLWERLGLLGEGRRYIDRIFELIDHETPLTNVASLLRRAAILRRDTDRLGSLALMERSTVLYRQLSEPLNLGSALGFLGGTYVYLGRYTEAKAALDEARALLQGSGRAKSLSNVANDLGSLAVLTNDADEARRCYGDARDLARKLGDSARESIALINLGEMEFGRGDVSGAIQYALESVSRLRSADQRLYLSSALINLATYLTEQDNHAEARPHVEEAFELLREQGGHWLRLCLQLLALIAAVEGRHAEAAQLIGFVDADYARSGEVREPTELRIYERLLHRLAANLPAAKIQSWMKEGSRWTEDDAADFAMRRVLTAPRRK